VPESTLSPQSGTMNLATAGKLIKNVPSSSFILQGTHKKTSPIHLVSIRVTHNRHLKAHNSLILYGNSLKVFGSTLHTLLGRGVNYVFFHIQYCTLCTVCSAY
jgi:hypothetical protein